MCIRTFLRYVLRAIPRMIGSGHMNMMNCLKIWSPRDWLIFIMIDTNIIFEILNLYGNLYTM
jgi:hypothetical protein